MNHRTRYIFYAAVAAIPFVLLLHLSSHLELERYQTTTRMAQFDDDRHIPSADDIATASLNYETAAADVLWLGMLFYASEQRTRRLPREDVTQYADAIIGLDPYYNPVYSWHNTFRYGTNYNPSYDDLQAANRILAEGLEYFPDQWGLARTIAINYHDAGRHFHLDDEKRIADLRDAIHYAEKGADIDGAPADLVGLAFNFRNRIERLRQGLPEYGDIVDGQLEATDEELEFLLRRYFAADDDRQRESLRRQLLHMGAEEELVERISRYEREFRQMHRQRHGYLPADAYLLVDYALYDYSSRR